MHDTSCSGDRSTSSFQSGFPSRFAQTSQFFEEVAAHARQQVIVAQCRLPDERVHDVEAGLRAVRHPEGDGAIQLNHWRRRQRGQRHVERGNPIPVGLVRGARARMAGGNRGLKRVHSLRATQAFRALERDQPAADEKTIPLRAILIEEQNWLARGTHARS